MTTANTTLNILVQMNIKAARQQLLSLKTLFNQMQKDPQLEQTKKLAAVEKQRQKMVFQTNKAQKELYSFSGLKDQYKELNQISSTVGKNTAAYKQTKFTIDKINKSLGYTHKQMGMLRHRTKAFNFDFLTLIFAGMYMQRVFGGMFNSIIDSYKKITGMNSQFNKGVLKLNAGFGYLKFAIGNALNSPGIIKMIQKFSDMITSLGDYFIDHPKTAQTLMWVLGGLAAIGTLSISIGGLMQMQMLLNIFSASSAGAAVTNFSLFVAAATKLAAIGAIAFGFKFIYDANKDSVENNGLSWNNIFKTAIGAALISGGLISFIPGIGVATALKGALLIGTITAGVSVGVKLIYDADKSLNKDFEMPNGLSKAWKTIQDSLKSILGGAFVGAAIGGTLGSVLPGVGTAVGAGIGALVGTITVGVGLIIKMIPHIDWGGLFEKSLFNRIANPFNKNKNTYEIDNLFKNTKKDIDNLQSSYTNLKDPIDTINGVINTYYNKNTDVHTIMPKVNKDAIQFNTGINTSNIILPKNNNLIQQHTKHLNAEERALNRAAAAQERLNRARAGAKHGSSSSNNTSTSNNSPVQVFTSVSSTTQTGAIHSGVSSILGPAFTNLFG